MEDNVDQFLALMEKYVDIPDLTTTRPGYAPAPHPAEHPPGYSVPNRFPARFCTWRRRSGPAYPQSSYKTLPERTCHWIEQSVVNILERMEYTGCTCNFKTHSKSYKLKKRPCRSALVMRRLCLRSSCTLSHCSFGTTASWVSGRINISSRIARILEADEVLTVKALCAQQKGKTLPERTCHWIEQSVVNILERYG